MARNEIHVETLNRQISFENTFNDQNTFGSEIQQPQIGRIPIVCGSPQFKSVLTDFCKDNGQWQSNRRDQQADDWSSSHQDLVTVNEPQFTEVVNFQALPIQQVNFGQTISQLQTIKPLSNSKLKFQKTTSMFATRVSADENLTYIDKDIVTNFVRNKRDRRLDAQSDSIFQQRYNVQLRSDAPNIQIQLQGRTQKKIKRQNMSVVEYETAENLMKSDEIIKTDKFKHKLNSTQTSFMKNPDEIKHYHTKSDSILRSVQYSNSENRRFGHHKTKHSTSFDNISDAIKQFRLPAKRNDILDLSSIQLSLDKEEIFLQKTENVSGQNLFSQGLIECSNFTEFSLRKYQIYSCALNEVINRLPGQHQQLKDILSRISMGFQSSAQDIRLAVKKSQVMFEKKMFSLQYSLKSLNEEFEKYKVKNDLDRLFVQGFDLPRCSRVLKQVSELMQETDWKIIDKDIVQAQASQDIKSHLKLICEEYEKVVKERLAHVMEQTETFEKDFEKVVEKTKTQTMSAVEFGEKLLNENQEQLAKTIKTTSQVVNSFYDGQRKKMKNVQTQAFSLSELFYELNEQLFAEEADNMKLRATINVLQSNLNILSIKYNDTNSEVQTQQKKIVYLEQVVNDNEYEKEVLIITHEDTKERLGRTKNYVYQVQSELVTSQKTLKKYENLFINQERRIVRLQKRNEDLCLKLVQVSGQDELDALLQDQSTSSTEEELVSKMSHANFSYRSSVSKQNNTEEDEIPNKSQIKSQKTRKQVQVIKKNSNVVNENISDLEILSDQKSELKIQMLSNDSSEKILQNKTAEPKFLIQKVIEQKSQLHFDLVEKRVEQPQKLKVVTFEETKVQEKERERPKIPQVKHEQPIFNKQPVHEITKQKTVDNIEQITSNQIQVKATIKQKPNEKPKLIEKEVPLINNIQEKNTNQTKKPNPRPLNQKKIYEEPRKEISSQTTQTDLEPLIILMCNILLNELLNQQPKLTEEQIQWNKKIKTLVERIRSRAAHASATLIGLVGVTIASPQKITNEFSDIHQATVKAYQSWHLKLNEAKH